MHKTKHGCARLQSQNSVAESHSQLWNKLETGLGHMSSCLKKIKWSHIYNNDNTVIDRMSNCYTKVHQAFVLGRNLTGIVFIAENGETHPSQVALPLFSEVPLHNKIKLPFKRVSHTEKKEKPQELVTSSLVPFYRRQFCRASTQQSGKSVPLCSLFVLPVLGNI